MRDLWIGISNNPAAHNSTHHSYCTSFSSTLYEDINTQNALDLRNTWQKLYINFNWKNTNSLITYRRWRQCTEWDRNPTQPTGTTGPANTTYRTMHSA